MSDLAPRIMIVAQHQTGPLQQVTSQIGMAKINRVIVRIDTVVLQDLLGLEVVHEFPLRK